jgi:hypothetical protein
VPQLVGPVDMKGVAFVPLERPRVTRTIGLITRRDETLLPAATAMFDAVQASLGQHCRAKGAEIHDGKIHGGKTHGGKSRVKAPARRARASRRSMS